MVRDTDGERRPSDSTERAGGTGRGGSATGSVNRRTVLRTGAVSGAVLSGAALAGCLSDEGDDPENGTDDPENESDDPENGTGDDPENGTGDDPENGGEENGEEENDWIQLFNGEDLDGWTPKIEGYEAGEDPEDNFVVEDGLLRVTYDDYDSFAVGHLFHEEEFSHYLLHAKYRFVEDSAAGQIGAYRNNGLMLHGERPEEMGVDKSFPDSLELQFLGEAEDSDSERPNGDLCTPGTQAENIPGELVTQHCWNATEGSTYYGERWVHAVAVVRGDELVQHVLEDDGIVLEYQKTQMDDGTPIEEGTISIQSEGHPTDFEVIEVLELDPNRAIEPGSIPEEVEHLIDG